MFSRLETGTPLNFIYVGGQDSAEFKLCLVIIRYCSCKSQYDIGLERELASVGPSLTEGQKVLHSK